MPLTTEVQLVGLGRPESFTCQLPESDENVFWAKNGMGLDTFNELWTYCKGHWSDRKVAVIQHDGFHQDGTPKNPVVIAVREAA